MIGVDEVTVYNWEKNRSSPRLQHTPKVVEFLGYVPFKKEPEKLGERIVYYRRLAGMAQKELARKLGVDPSILAKWEKGESEPRSIFQELLFNLPNFILL